ncbi:MAG: helicase C-terminal domain-containing protein, partial [Candidatus Nitrosopolaris sp.]
MSDNLNFIKNFPFPTKRESQFGVLNQIGTAFASGYKYIVLEAPTGFGKSPVAIATALTLGTSYICTSTKDLQSQYARDFLVVKVAKGKNNFICEVKSDFIKDGTYKCGLDSNNAKCHHTSADYGPCMNNESFKGSGCKYRTFPEDYTIINKEMREEKVFIHDDATNHYQNEYSQWSYLENLKENRLWKPCDYYHQLNIALTASHSTLNYPMLLSLLPTRKFPSRELLILDEAHLLETEIVGFTGISISKRRWKRYIPNLRIVDYGYDDIEKWINFLIELQTQMIDLTGNVSEELAVEAITDTQKLTQAINNILSNPKNWIVSEIKKEGDEVISFELKPLDVSPYCKGVFQKCDKTLMMSATILDSKTFCQSLGLAYDEVKVIQVGSDFPLHNRPLFPMNIAHLNNNTLQRQDIKIKISRASDNIMTIHRNYKGIILTTSYEQVNFIRENISQSNKSRLLETHPDIPRDEVIAKHVNSIKPTVLISPSLYLGLDLKDDLSRFQIITKVPYPDLGDRWIDAKRK